MFALFICDPEAALHAQLVWETDQVWREHELELDLERERQLHPPTETTNVDYVDLVVAVNLGLAVVNV